MRFLVRLFAVIGFLFVLLAGGAVALVWRHLDADEPLGERVVLTLDLEAPLAEGPPADPLSAVLSGRRGNLQDAIAALDRAGRDPRVKGVLARVGDDAHGMAATQELRDAVKRFRATGRFALAHAETFGELAENNIGYYLATAFDEIWLQPVGVVGLTGLAAEVPFARCALDRWSIQPQITKRAEYKTAFDSATESGFTPAHREMLESLVGNLAGQLVAGIAEGRKLEPAVVQGLLDRGPFTGTEAKAERLVDGFASYDEAERQARDRAGGTAELVELEDYAGRAADDTPEDAPLIAVVTGSGPIQRGDAEGLFDEGGVMSGEAVARAIDDAAARAPKAIVFRVDSPGGSAVASETIRQAVLRAKARRIPVVVSMGNVAGSGGYWVAMDADRIVAQPGTLTGSIGVIAGKVATAGLWGELGVDWGRVAAGAQAGMNSAITPFDEREWARLNALVDDTYRGFVERVAKGRNLPPERVEQIARGRVWTGAQAQEIKLVDALGGFETALRQAKALAGLPEDGRVRLAHYPEPDRALAFFADLVGDEVEAGVSSRLAARLLPLLTGQSAEGPAAMPATGRLR